MELGTSGWNTQARCGRARQRAVRKAAVLVAFLAACCVLSRIKTLTPESYTSSYLAGRRLLGVVAEAEDLPQPEPEVEPGPPRYARLRRAAPPDNGQESDPDGSAKPTGGDKGKTKGKPGEAEPDKAGDGKKPTNGEGNGKPGQVDSADDAADKDRKPEPEGASGKETGGGENPEKEPPEEGRQPVKPDESPEESPPKVASTDDEEKPKEKPKQGQAEPEEQPKKAETKPEDTEAKPEEEEGEEKKPAVNSEAKKPGGEPDGAKKPGKETNPESKPKERGEEETAEPKAGKKPGETTEGKEPRNDDGENTEPGPNVEVAPKNGSSGNATKTAPGKGKKGNETASEGEAIECIRPAYHEFPPDLFSHDARAKGGVVVHILVVLYMFYALAVVCDDYFIASLEECCACRSTMRSTTTPSPGASSPRWMKRSETAAAGPPCTRQPCGC